MPLRTHLLALVLLLSASAASPLTASAQMATSPPAYGPYSARVLPDGIGLTKPLHAYDPLFAAGSSWSLSLWVNPGEIGTTTLLAGLGEPTEAFPRFLGLRDGKPFFWTGEQHTLSAPAAIGAGTWHSIAVSVQANESHLFVDGKEVAHGSLPVGPSSPALYLAPVTFPNLSFHHFGGRLALVQLTRALSADDQKSLAQPPFNLDTLAYEDASKAWPVQTRQWSGYTAPQDPSSLPRSLAPFQAGTAKTNTEPSETVPSDPRTLTLRQGWRMAEQASTSADGAHISTSSFDASSWYAATVPGTVLTTLVDRGVYPDPDFGLNNMAIPDSLSRKQFWFRTTFEAPKSALQGHPEFTFHGINYHAIFWLNGKPLGEMKGAFSPAIFDVAGLLHAGSNTLAVLISPPPHPGIPHEQSLAAGAGENGGLQLLDGPTFAATEGWDWMPAIRDRNMGIWQDVTLSSKGAVWIDNPKVIAIVPLPDTSHAAVTLQVPLKNETNAPIRGVLEIAFENVTLKKTVNVPAGGTTITLAPSDFPQLNIDQPRLWWPNGYGTPELYHLTTTFRIGSQASDVLKTRFGIREITYELSLFDSSGHARRVEIDPAVAALRGERLVDESHEGIRETPLGWVASLTPAAEKSPAVHTLTDTAVQPALVIKVNGVRIACKGGSWGMDDMRKRVSRDRLEPFFRLHREAHLNMIRNWMGQNTEDIFFDLADEYGLLVWNDFWDSTQDYNLEPDDSALFLRNAHDTIARTQNHPSIAIWCGRNEGVPSPTIDHGLEDLITQLDGTRFYSASSNRVNLHDSGPYKYQEPEEYFTSLALGFAVEIGLPSPPTLEAFQSFLPKEDQWPISDDWAYHDWHQGGNGDTAPFMQAMNEQFGPPSDLADFDRKAQMLNYVGHRAVFEGFNAHLWGPNSGRMLWMTQPAWPSTQWQIFSHDYDTHASYFGTMKASEIVHVQMNLPDHKIVVVNNTTAPPSQMTVNARVFDLNSTLLFERNATLNAAPNAVTDALALDLRDSLVKSPVVFVKLILSDANGKSISENFYWVSATKPDLRKLNDLASVHLQATATVTTVASEQHVLVTLTNPAQTTALATKLTLLNGQNGPRILPAFYSDNYVSILPGEKRILEIIYPISASSAKPVVALRGWNVANAIIEAATP
jgi:hypothetical protein